MTSASSPAPWDRRPDEGAKAHAAFIAYRDLGTQRSLSAAAAEVGKTLGLLKRWSAQHEWLARAAAWDRHLDHERQRAAKADAKEWTSKALLELREIQLKALGRLREMDPEEMTPGEALRCYTDAASLMRRLSGADDERRVAPILYLPANGRDTDLARSMGMDGDEDDDV